MLAASRTSMSSMSVLRRTAPQRAGAHLAVALMGAGLFSLGAARVVREVRKLDLPEMPRMGGGPNFSMPSVSMPSFERLDAFEARMSRKEALKILNVADRVNDKDAVRHAHRRLLMANHPDKGGSTYVATKINEAKEALLGKKGV